ncbi:MAG: Sec-independent protein translocase protein TatB [Paracoccus sp. (in: a-proteobacteria)]
MMLDIGWSELLLIGVVALIVIGPRDLPHMFRALGRITGKVRSMAREFSSAMEDAARDSGLDEVTKSINDVRDVTSKRSLGVDALDRAADRFEKWDPGISSARNTARSGSAADDPMPTDRETAVLAAQTAAEHPATEQGNPAGQRRLHAIRRSDSKDV